MSYLPPATLDWDQQDAAVAAAIADLQVHLLTAPIAVWHDVFARCDWDLHEDLILWMLNRPECDFAIAFSAFHLSRPCQFLTSGRGPDEIDAPDRCIWAVVLKNWTAGSYRDRTHGPDQARLRPMLEDLLHNRAERAADCPFDLPPDFLQMPDRPAPLLPPEWSPAERPDLRALYLAAELRFAPDPVPRRRGARRRGADLLRTVVPINDVSETPEDPPPPTGLLRRLLHRVLARA